MLLAGFLLAAAPVLGQVPAEQAVVPKSLLRRADGWFASEEGGRAIGYIISQQLPVGGWHKNYTVPLAAGPAAAAAAGSASAESSRGESAPSASAAGASAPGGSGEWAAVATIDNDATYTELRLLARAVRLSAARSAPVAGRPDDVPTATRSALPTATPAASTAATPAGPLAATPAVQPAASLPARAAFLKGLHFLFSMQYPNGGFPQRFPLQNNYGRHITYNDNATLGVLQLLRDIADGRPDFAWVPEADRARAAAALARGVECVLATQIREPLRGTSSTPSTPSTPDDPGRLTLWCQQHDEVSLLPAPARAYELPAVASTESAGLVLFLMDIPEPDERIRRAVTSAVAYFGSAAITGQAYRNRTLTPDPAAPPLWARFYELGTLPPAPPKPLFVDRDGSRHAAIAELSEERQHGYAWYSTVPNQVLARYPAWAAAHLAPAAPPPR